MPKLSKLKWSITLLGWRATVLSCWFKFLALLGFDKTQNEEHWDYLYNCFDHRFNVETTEAVLFDGLNVEGGEEAGMHHYEPTSPVAFCMTIEQLPIDFHNFAFVDYGSGKGRALFMADFFPFNRIIGVELSPSLMADARCNVESFAKQQDASRFELVQENATTYELPDQPLVLYFFNPFNAEVLGEVLNQIERSWRANPRPMYVVFQHPEFRSVLDDADFLSLRRESHEVFVWLVYEVQPSESESSNVCYEPSSTADDSMLILSGANAL
jgi:hypothetical protein